MVRTLVGLAAGVLALTASCAEPSGGASDRPRPAQPGTSMGTAGSPSASSPTTPPEDVPGELRFNEPRLGGGTVRGASFAGQDLVMWFWAPW